MNLIKQLKNHANSMRGFIYSLIFPVSCVVCGEEGEWLCSDCYSGLEYSAHTYCLSCKTPNKYGEFCARCQSGYSLSGILIAGDYENEILATIIKTLKYRFVHGLKDTIGKYTVSFLLSRLNQIRLTSACLNNGQIWRRLDKAIKAPQIFTSFHKVLVVPVPLHKRRLRWRGFNQAEIIASPISKKFSLEQNTIDLIRTRYRKPQAKLNERQRKNSIIDCYAWQGQNLKKRHVLLIDDVTTTGSTLNECARVLKANGAGEVWGLVVAKG